MATEKHSGTSKAGDIHEAVQVAIVAAKESLGTDFVRWKLLDVVGDNGGFVLKNELTVTIEASGPKIGDPSAKNGLVP